MKEIINILHEGNYSCVIKNNETIHTFTQRGVADLYDLLTNKPELLKGAFLADKVVGKGAAALMILGGVAEIYTDIISLSALMLLREAGIQTDFGQVVPYIQNRDQTGWCPVEAMCYNEASAEAVFPLIENFINKIRLAPRV